MASFVEALDRGEILILFPEGTRGEPERMAPFKPGITHILRRRPDVPVFPVHLANLGMALPRGESLFVPFRCRADVGTHLAWQGDRQRFMKSLEEAVRSLAAAEKVPARP